MFHTGGKQSNFIDSICLAVFPIKKHVAFLINYFNKQQKSISHIKFLHKSATLGGSWPQFARSLRVSIIATGHIVFAIFSGTEYPLPYSPGVGVRTRANGINLKFEKKWLVAFSLETWKRQDRLETESLQNTSTWSYSTPKD